MVDRMRYTSLLVLAAIVLVAQVPNISGDRIRDHVKYLASDKLEGRGVGTPGEKFATEYIASQFAMIGAKPAGEHGTYFQRVPLVGATTQPNATLAAVGANQTVSFRWLDDFVGVSELQQPTDQFEAEAIFAKIKTFQQRRAERFVARFQIGQVQIGKHV